MLLERTIRQLDIGPLPPARAQELGQLGYMQWLGALPGGAEYRGEARRAHAMAAPLIHRSPALGVFCDLLSLSMTVPPGPLPLCLPVLRRRGGARARRAAR
ncbi:hypothetical protein [Pararhodobacter sp.]|jgi:hypothetical protein|uniref:hypothetical protein n=1 Tax=Pararhodobacter sp. TaxID=2127056 RepID=UPI002FDD4A15